MEDQLDALVKALESGNYNAAPSELREGSLMWWHSGRWATQDEIDKAYAAIDDIKRIRPLTPDDLDAILAKIESQSAITTDDEELRDPALPPSEP